MHIVNLTPHPIHIYAPDAPDTVTDQHAPLTTIPISGQVARIATTRSQGGTLHVDGLDVPLNSARYGAVEGIPEPAPGTLYLVSLPVATEMRRSGRDDLIVVDRLVRNSEETVVGCRALGRVEADTVDVDSYTYPHMEPRGILAGDPWENLLEGHLVRVLPPAVDELFGTVSIAIGAEMAHLEDGVARKMHEALGYARRRAGTPQCTECPEYAERVTGGSRMYRCVNGHTVDAESVLQEIRPCKSCHGYGNV